jgi:hypothetical protein
LRPPPARSLLVERAPCTTRPVFVSARHRLPPPRARTFAPLRGIKESAFSLPAYPSSPSSSSPVPRCLGGSSAGAKVEPKFARLPLRVLVPLHPAPLRVIGGPRSRCPRTGHRHRLRWWRRRGSSLRVRRSARLPLSVCEARCVIEESAASLPAYGSWTVWRWRRALREETALRVRRFAHLPSPCASLPAYRSWVGVEMWRCALREEMAHAARLLRVRGWVPIRLSSPLRAPRFASLRSPRPRCPHTDRGDMVEVEVGPAAPRMVCVCVHGRRWRNRGERRYEDERYGGGSPNEYGIRHRGDSIVVRTDSGLGRARS